MPSQQSPEQRQGLVVYARNKGRVSAFYQKALALAVEESETSHDLLLGHGCEVVVHAIPPEYAVGIELAEPPEPREETPFKPTFLVQDLEFVRAAAVETGGFLNPVERAWRFRGCIVLDGWDPEGNIVQFRQKR